ncbi:MAG: alpha/beta hydrolase-fold protein [Acidobacteriota bacterium]
MSWQPYRSAGLGDQPGTFWVWRDFPSPELGNARDIVVWAPPPSPEIAHARLPVLYFQDGQNVLDAETSHAGSWRAAHALAELARSGHGALAVAVAHTGEGRLAEYSPFTDALGRGGRGDAYLDFLASSVKPAVDARFPTRREASSTGLVGSSLGGLIAVYGVFKRPDAFGLAAALSPSFWFADDAMARWLEDQERVPSQIYLDSGRFERGRGRPWWPWHLGSWRYARSVRRVHRRLLRMGYVDGVDLCCLLDPEGEHREECWRRRLPGALSFLLVESTSTGAWAIPD